MNAHPGALALVSKLLSEGIRPNPAKPFPLWLQENIVLVDGPQKGELWSAEDAPYLVPIAECLDVDHPCNLVTVRKSQQTGVSILALAWSLYIADVQPDNILYAMPNDNALKDMESGKLSPLIDEWHKKIGREVIGKTSTGAVKGSSQYEKRFGDSALFMANANSKLDLSGKTSRYGIKDEVSKWEPLKTGEDPEELFFGRFTAFRRRKAYKILELSTPEVDSDDPLGDEPGHCRIDRSFIRSDQRFWFVRCPECGVAQVQFHQNLLIDRKHLHKSRYLCEGCGHEITETERVFAVRAGEYRPTKEGPDRHPGFHVDAFMSLMMSYGDIAEDVLRSEGRDESAVKDLYNLVYALPYKIKGNAPDHERLLERREEYEQYFIPHEGLLFVGGADVQHNGIFVELVAFAEDRQSWTVSAEFLPGATDDPNRGAWELLDELVSRTFRDAFGNERVLDGLTVDGGDGNRTNQVYEWCRRRPGLRFAIKGVDGHGVPAMSQPSNKSVTRRGKKKRFGAAMLWPVGTWTLKSEFYGNLSKPGLSAGKETDPPGYCHFGGFLGAEYFKQITAETYVDAIIRGKRKTGWEQLRRDNHFLDCRIYAMAMAEHLGLTTMRKDDWAALRERYRPEKDADLFESAPERIANQRKMTETQGSSSDTGVADRFRERFRRRK
ncbi:terminase gpA endonuclease subunit [uncultured Roseibium sp.]|uniref:terminase gpA endonuclease subunit n=1 Tax=uncultured Roseibium sp. TaxID=1936171 RepID=UPI002615583A|nr:terminase gpA endonuclease subunit [uncultured Roseibium sp.]